jgi:signal peptidase I
MEPAFHTGEYLIVDQLSYNFSQPQRGDVIVFKYPLLSSKFFIKRVIGLPGESIKIEGEEVWIKEVGNEEYKKINENYIEFPKNNFVEDTLEENEFFVMGDNRLASLDSRVWGPIKREDIVGKAFLRLFPVSKIDLLPGDF